MRPGYTTIGTVPFGDHLAPGTQPGGAFEGQVPRRSLYGLYERAKPQSVKGGWRTLSQYGESIDAIPIGRMPGNQRNPRQNRLPWPVDSQA